MSEAPLLEVSALVKTYRSPGVGPFARKNARPALAGRQLLDAARALVRNRRRIGLGQVDARAHRACA